VIAGPLHLTNQCQHVGRKPRRQHGVGIETTFAGMGFALAQQVGQRIEHLPEHGDGGVV
jgi:hypothetical protein